MIFADSTIGMLLSHFHFTLLGIFVLGYLDYLLTVVGYRLYRRYYSVAVQVEHYELNPFWQKSVRRMRLFDWRHLIFLIALCGWLWHQYLQLLEEPNVIGASNLLETSLGFIIFLYLIINLGHLANIYTFWRVGRSRFSGRSEGGYAETVHLTVVRTCKSVVLLLAVWAFARDWFFFGAAVGPLMLVLSFGLLARRASRVGDQQTVRKRDYFWILARMIILLLFLSFAWEWWEDRRPYSAHFSQGAQYQQDGELEKAIDEYKKAIKDKPGYYPAVFNLSIAYTQFGSSLKGLTTAAEALQLNPKDSQAHELFEEALANFLASRNAEQVGELSQ